VASYKFGARCAKTPRGYEDFMDPADTFSQQLVRAEMDTLDAQETKTISTKQERRTEEMRLEKLKVRLAVLLERIPPPA
jgi:hypothetical protein